MDFKPQIIDLINSHDHKLNSQKPSEWAEENRVMGTSTTAMPGKFSYDKTPYLREPVDCLSLDSDARVIAVMKGAQIGFSTGVIESGIGWIISQQPGNIMLLARDEALVKTMMETKLDPMIDGCGIRHLIKPNVIRKRNQRTGDTSKGKEFAGGMLMAGSVQTPGRMRQVSIQYGFIDDFEAAPQSDKNAGSTSSLIETRFASYYKKMKLFYISTPEVKQTSNIEPIYELGDKRRFNVPCPCCGDFIILEWEIDLDNNKKAGVTWQVNNLGELIDGSVGYICQSCNEFFDLDKHKKRMLMEGFWKPTKKPIESGNRSYHISSLYAPPGMYNVDYYVREWLKIHPQGGEIDVASKKTFYNTVLGLTWEEKTETPEAKYLAKNTRSYKIGIVPNSISKQDGNGDIVLLTCACDLNGKIDDARLDFEVVGWSVEGASYSILHGSIGTFVPLENQKKNVDLEREKWTYREGVENSVWPVFKEIISKEYQKDDGGKMKVLCSGVDTGYFTNYAYNFLGECNPPMLIGLKGKDQDKYIRNDSNKKIFTVSNERSDLYLLDVNLIKDDLAEKIKLKWNGNVDESQPYGFLNFPEPDQGLYGWNNFFSHFEAEHKILQKNKDGDYIAARWVKKTSASQNHLFDCHIYNKALKEIITHLICKDQGIQYPDWRKYCQIVGVL